MTNYDRWQKYMKDIGSPQSYIDFGFYYMIAAALQRRVWVGSENMPCYPTMYVIMVGKPALGKGNVLKHVDMLLRANKLKQKSSQTIEEKEKSFSEEKEAVMEPFNQTLVNGNSAGSRILQEQLLIPVGANATTYEKMLDMQAKATRALTYKIPHPTEPGKQISKTYFYCSMCYCLQELASLIPKRADKIVDYLQEAYDCNDYKYETKNQGEALLKRPSLCILAGTNPNFMETSFNDKLLNEGFASRSVFIFEHTPRFDRYDVIQWNLEQLTYKQELINHLKLLTDLYGEVKFSEEADAHLKHWYENVHSKVKPNDSPKLEYYYGRKKLHVWKLAMAIHFSESLSMTIEVSSCKKALELLELIEKKMHFALSFDNTNPLFNVSKKIKSMLRAAGEDGKTELELLYHFWGNVNGVQLKEIINYLFAVGEIKMLSEKPVRYAINKKEEI